LPKEGAASLQKNKYAVLTPHLPNCRQISLAKLHPARLGSACSFTAQKTNPMTIEPSHRPMTRILLAEDDDSMRGFLERALSRAGHQVIAFANGQEALDRLMEEPFTLLLTDIVMPRMDGIELARRASEIDPTLKIMFITGFAAVTLNNDSNAPKDVRVLSKPFHLKDLVREVDRLLAA
jgi:two-component system, cell cycle response regulator CpdR